MKYTKRLILFAVLLFTALFFFESRLIPDGFQETYTFESGYMEAPASPFTKSTPAIPLPDYLRREGTYLCENNTGYDICIFTSTDGFLLLEQGEYNFQGRPVALFLLKPESSHTESGTLELTKADGILTAQYSFQEEYSEISGKFRLKLKF